MCETHIHRFWREPFRLLVANKPNHKSVMPTAMTAKSVGSIGLPLSFLMVSPKSNSPRNVEYNSSKTRFDGRRDGSHHHQPRAKRKTAMIRAVTTRAEKEDS
jgi:hypothetical protein